MSATLAAAALLMLGQYSAVSGTYRPTVGDPIEWQINKANTLVWGGAAYLPVGLRIEGTVEAVNRVSQQGVKDVVVELPVSTDWSPVVAALEKAGMRYLITLDSAAPATEGIIVDPMRYRQIGVTNETGATFEADTITEAYAVAVTVRDNEIQWSGEAKPEGGRIFLKPTLADGPEHVMYLFPRTQSLAQIDAWEGWDAHRDELLATLRRAKFGPGLRGLINPAGEAVSLRPGSERIIPQSAFFRMELRQFLEEKYRNVATAIRAWQIGSNAIEKFDEVARLIPLWNGQRGVALFYDPVAKTTLRCGRMRDSAVWTDLQTVIDRATARRYDRLVNAIHQVVNVPVLQDWRGWAAPYETTRPALSGLAMRVRGSTPSTIADGGARAASSVGRWPRPGWLLASEMDPGEGRANTTPNLLAADLAMIGARGVFFREADMPWAQAIAQATLDPSLSTVAFAPFFYPEAATSPAAPQRLPGGFYWLPSPVAGNPVDLGNGFFAYRYLDAERPYTALWSARGSGRVKLRLADPKPVGFVTLDGSDPNPRSGKNAIEVTVGELPLLITDTSEIPIPEICMSTTVARFERLEKAAQSLNVEYAQERFTFRDALTGFDRNPGSAYATMRLQYWRLTLKLAPYVWVEAEGVRNHTMSESSPWPGAASGNVLRLRSLAGGQFKAEYSMQVRTEADQMLWVAGNFPAESLNSIRLRFGNQDLTLEPEPVVRYGSGLAWYRAGLTRLTGSIARLSVEVLGDRPHDLAFDAFVLAPEGFTPRGAFPMELEELFTKK